MIELKQVTKRYKDEMIENISFTVNPGEIVVLDGEDIKRKSMLLRLIMNLEPRDAGEILVCGIDNIKEEVKVKSSIGYVSFSVIDGSLSLSEYEGVYKKSYKKYNYKAFDGYIKKWGLKCTTSFKKCTFDMNLKGLLALTLSHNPDVILIEEPVTEISEETRAEIMEALKEYVSDGKRCVLYSTGKTTDCEEFGNRRITV